MRKPEVADPDATVDHFPQRCAGCGGALDSADAFDHRTHQAMNVLAKQSPEHERLETITL